ncbi:MAG: hypothetical protein Q8O67_08580 [Deltaproteobacteria bacterium]|nr:hypothetical protein [Deltaproteobacteria bacterium]
MRIALVLVAAVTLGGCAGFPLAGAGQPAEPPLAVDVRVGGLRADEQDALKTSLCAISGVVGCEMKKEAKEVLFTLQYRGSLHALQSDIGRIPHPGLKVEEVKASLRFRGFDNQPPALTVLSPKDGTVTAPDVEVIIEARDADVARVEIGGRTAVKQRPGIFAARLSLAEGPNTVPVSVVDEAGNETTATLALTLDTTPPDMTATVKVVVEGKVERGSAVFVDGQPVSVDLLGGWRVELIVKKGQRTVEIVAIDTNGNKKTEQRSIGVE